MMPTLLEELREYRIAEKREALRRASSAGAEKLEAEPQT
jgi:hypothetical protein